MRRELRRRRRRTGRRGFPLSSEGKVAWGGGAGVAGEKEGAKEEEGEKEREERGGGRDKEGEKEEEEEKEEEGEKEEEAAAEGSTTRSRTESMEDRAGEECHWPGGRPGAGTPENSEHRDIKASIYARQRNRRGGSPQTPRGETPQGGKPPTGEPHPPTPPPPRVLYKKRAAVKARAKLSLLTWYGC